MGKNELLHSFSEFGVTCERGALVNGAELFLFRRAGMSLACNIIFLQDIVSILFLALLIS